MNGFKKGSDPLNSGGLTPFSDRLLFRERVSMELEEKIMPSPKQRKPDRRTFLKRSAAAVAGAGVPLLATIENPHGG